MRRRQLQQASYAAPFVFTNPYRYGSVAVAVLEIGDGYLCIEYQIGISQVTVFAAKKDDFPRRYAYAGCDGLKQEVAELRRRALSSGATLEAIQLLGQLTPITKLEEATMADTKLSRKTADTAGLKAAAKTAPVKGKPTAKVATTEAPKRKGNPEALAKAREARKNGVVENRKYKVLVKRGDVKVREGSWTEAMVGHILANKDTDSANAALKGDRPYKDRKLDFSWAAKKGYIEF